MPITPPPDVPSRTNPSTFSARMDAFLAWFPDFVDDYNDDGALRGAIYVGVAGGSANALTFTTGVFSGSIPTGAIFRFQVAAANTGAVTINVDGIGAVTAYTATGAPMPAGYLTTGQVYTAYWTGSSWRVDRPIERGSNANGEYVRFEDGTQICIHSITGSATTTAAGSIFTSGDDSWTFPAAFVSTTGLALAATSNFSGRWINVYAATTTTATIRQFNATSNASTPSLRLLAIGRWY
jgi:hypothetical protein